MLTINYSKFAQQVEKNKHLAQIESCQKSMQIQDGMIFKVRTSYTIKNVEKKLVALKF